MVDLLRVFHGVQHVGDLHRQRDGRLAFEYAGSWIASQDKHAFAISVSLPLAPGLNREPAAHAFFANLLPEGHLREAVARQLGISASNDFALLEAVGGECAGALTILPEMAVPDPTEEGYEPLEPGAIAEMARRFSVLAEVTGRHRPRLSLAGAQDKLPVMRREDGTYWLPTGGAPSTHILKVPSRDFGHLPANEVLVTGLAQRLGLVTAEVDLASIEGVEIAVVRRFDRVAEGEAVLRLHQEDLCQALGLMPGTKYENEGGPGFPEAMQIVRERSTSPLVDAQQLLRWLCFGLLAGNADGHGKNLSLLWSRGGVRLSPFYDLVCTRAYPNIDRFLAMSIGGERDPGQIGRRHWEALAGALKIGPRVVVREVEALSAAMPAAFDEVCEAHVTAHGESPVIQRARQVIRKQCRRTSQLLR